jgi:C-terminal processing protease CtpA/Prc
LIERYFFKTFHGFDLYYQLYVDRSESFKIEYIPYGTTKTKTVTLAGITFEERKRILLTTQGVDEQRWFKEPSPKFEVDKTGDYALLTISRSFYDKGIDPNFDALMKSAFARIKEEKINNLTVDLRNNEGGDEHQQMELMSYLYDQPFKLYQNIYLSHLDFRPLKQIIMERDTNNLLFHNDDHYMRKMNDNLWINNYEYSDNLILQPPKENVFKGKLYVLMNGITFSSAADLIADIKRTTNAVIIGEESGGTYEGPTGGDNIVIQLPNSKIMIRISPNIQIGYMYQKHPVGRGVLPTHEVKYSIKDVVEKRDLELELVKTLIRKQGR